MIAIPKNAREEIRIERQDYQGHDLIQLRVWFRADDGEMRPSKKGLAIRADIAPAVQAAIAEVMNGETG